ncbi:Eco57I restriction-modification methylase domain-containing protein [Rhodococcus sp. As11]|uniref:Eco57I restriction-modification methylase domain-containing protein n=1 Tax=Rhodococcus sp. As11 TaxID=3029189 RepID=UPI003B7D3FB4
MRTVNNPSGHPANSITADDFLAEAESANVIPWSKPSGAPVSLTTRFIHFGHGQNPLEIVVAEAEAAPKSDEMRRLWKTRANKVAPVLLVVLHQGRASALGTSGEPAPLHDLDIAQVERICAAALAEHDRHAAAVSVGRLVTALAKDGLSSGLLNSGLFASHELREGVPQRADWAQACERSSRLLGLSGIGLVKALGYDTAPRGSTAVLLAHEGEHRAVAVLLTDDETFDRPSDRFGAMSPVAHAIAAAQDEKVAWVIVLRGTQIRLYPVDPTIGVGRKGQAETYTELDLALLTDDESGYLELLFAADALRPGGTVHQILAASSNFVVGLSERLRDRVYVDVVPDLAVAVARHMEANGEDDLDEAYHRTLLILFRMLFLAYAEDRGLLPYGRNPRYDRHAVKTLAKAFTDTAPEFDSESTDLWDQLLNLWDAIDVGRKDWGVPAYNGGLFSKNATTHPAGAAIAAMRITDAEIGPALRALLVDLGGDGTQGPVDFRSLSVREFGTIYEGLLESSLSVAPTDLTIDHEGTYVPAKSEQSITVPAGQVYFHNASGQRKATGSYFTKSFAVEHLLDTALEPALTDHLTKVKALLETGEATAAYETFFDFRVADLAMGSAHFLVAAVDRIEARFTAFLTRNPIPAVADELGRLGAAAREHLGDQADLVEIEPSMLLRRQIARRCIYGLDINLVAVELARLAIWIHTFVPGLPMSSLEHNLIEGNSLTGIGSLDEALDALEPNRTPGQDSFFSEALRETLSTAREQLVTVARSDEAQKSEVRQAAVAYRKALEEAADAKHLFDAAAAIRMSVISLAPTVDMAVAAVTREPGKSRVEEALATLKPVHMPYRFPEVFLRDNPGFDVVLGNPPWDEVMVEEPKFWQRYFPGVMGLPPRSQTKEIKRYREERPDLVSLHEAEIAAVADYRSALLSGPYPGLGTGDVDLYKAFSWRFWKLLRLGGRMGVVFPRSLLNSKGSKPWREELLDRGEFSAVTTLVNTKRWIFPDVHPQYSIVLLSVLKPDRPADQRVWIAGPFHSLEEFLEGRDNLGTVSASGLRSWSEAASFPLLPDNDSVAVFTALRTHPRLDSGTDWLFRPVAEFHATNDKKTFDAGGPADGRWPVLTGASFNLWNPDFGDPYAHADPDIVIEALQNRRLRQARLKASAFYQLPTEIVENPLTLPCRKPRIAFRDIARATDTRTALVTLVPPNALLVNTAPYLLRREGDEKDEAFLLGVLSSIPLDWYARRYVEVHLNLHIFNALPIPRPTKNHPLRERVVQIAGSLAAVDDRYTEWADAVGVPVGSIRTDQEREALVAELDAVVALLYGLERSQLAHIFDTFHRGWDNAVRREAALAHFDRWKGMQ